MAIKNYTESWIDTYNQYLGSIKFTEGDFSGLKEVIRDYVTRQNPEGYNDWQESSEVGMFVNAIAYLGENTLYRTDLNVNDLFPSTTERKQSLLNFTRMLSYSSKRNICANGLAKLVSVSTTQDITDTSGTLLKGVTIKWNDKTNEDWMEQFLTVLNSAFVYTNQFGKPTKNVSINNISNQLYQVNSAVNSACAYPFSTSINGKNQQFEVVNPDIDVSSSTINELTPIPERMFQLLYRNDGAGNNSINTGFFVYWKQGILNNEIYEFDEKIENNIIEVSKENINNNDVWFEELNKDTNYVSRVWTKLDASEYLSYTNTPNDIRTIYKVETQENDKIKVKFSDGYFGDIPYGLYRLWYRTSNGNDGLYIKPSDMTNLSVQIPYFNNANNSEDNIYYLTLTFSIADVSHIRQAVPSESLESMRERAPEVYSTQDRMVTGKDYNYFPKSIGQQLKVLKAVERTYAGNSRFVDLNDPSGSYNNVNVLATDGYIYTETKYTTSNVPVGSMTAEQIYTKYVEEKLSLKELTNLYYQNYEGTMIPPIDGTETDLYYYWNPKIVNLGTNYMEGGLIKHSSPLYSQSDLDNLTPRYNWNTELFSDVSNDMTVGDMICFQEYKLKLNGEFIVEEPTNNIVWAKIKDIDGEIISISEVLDTNKLWKVRKSSTNPNEISKLYNFITAISTKVKDDIINLISDTNEQTTFGITYIQGDSTTTTTTTPPTWEIIYYNDDTKAYLDQDNLVMTDYNGEYEKPVANWIFRLTYSTDGWIIDNHQTHDIFGSVEQNSFFFNTSKKDSSNDGYFITNDTIKVMKDENIGVMKDYYWKPYNVIKYVDGYVEPQEVSCQGYDSDKDAIIDVPTQFLDLTTSIKDLIFINTKDSESEADMEMLSYVDLTNNYESFGANENERAFNTSLWKYFNKSGYYYLYHKVNEVIPANTTSKKGSASAREPFGENVLLSNGTIKSFRGDTQPLDGIQNNFTFFDFIKEYKNVSEPVYYDDLIVDDEGNKEYKHGYLYYYNAETQTLSGHNGEINVPYEEGTDFSAVKGVSGLTFLWKHYATEDYIIDPCSSNIIDMFVLTNTYYNQVQEWIQSGKNGVFPKAPSAYELKSIFQTLENNKMVSDTMVWHPITYKLIFGHNGDVETHCIFKVIKSDSLLSDNEVKKQVVQCIDEYFRNMEVGETFYFTQLSTYIENKIPEMVKTVLIVPTDTATKFGNLFQIKCSENEILLSSATLDDIEVISNITTQNIRVSS